MTEDRLRAQIADLKKVRRNLVELGQHHLVESIDRFISDANEDLAALLSERSTSVTGKVQETPPGRQK